MMNHGDLLKELYKFQPEEQIYKEYYFMNDRDKNLDAFLSKYPTDYEPVKYIQNPKTITVYKPEDEFLNASQNVSLIKHPRYLPLFYHQHAFFEIIYVLSGQCVQLFPDQKITLYKGDLCLISPNTMHGIEVFDDEGIILNIIIRRSTFLDIFINAVRDKTQISLFFLENIYAKKKIRYILFHTAKDFIIRNYILDMYQEQINLDEFSDRIICSLLTIFFSQLTRRHNETLEIPDAYRQKNDSENAMIQYIINNYATVTIKNLAREFHFSEPHCSRLIKAITGFTFSQFLTNIRLQQGENLLLFTQLSLADISNQLGYKNPETFIRVFKKYYETTPSHYRKTFSALLK